MCFVHPRFGRDGTPVEELLIRFNAYGKSLAASSDGKQKVVTIFAGINPGDLLKIDSQFSTFVQVIRVSDPTNNFLAFALKSAVLIRRQGMRFGLLVAGDFWVGGLATFILGKLNRESCSTQITLHGNPMSASENRVGNTPTVRSIVFRLLLRNFDSIRLVSINLKELLRFDYERLESKTFVSPVHVPTSVTALTSNRLNNTIVVLGRLHIERNPLEALKIVSHVLINNPLVRLELVGDGPLQSEVLKYCEKEINSHSYTFWGLLPHEEALRVLASSSVLLSSAPHEGYGLSIREALSCGVPVVARSNPETLGLARSWPKILCTYDSVTEAAKLVTHYLEVPPEEADFSEFQAKSMLENARDLQSLTQCWVKLIN